MGAAFTLRTMMLMTARWMKIVAWEMKLPDGIRTTARVNTHEEEYQAVARWTRPSADMTRCRTSTSARQEPANSSFVAYVGTDMWGNGMGFISMPNVACAAASMMNALTTGTSAALTTVTMRDGTT